MEHDGAVRPHTSSIAACATAGESSHSVPVNEADADEEPSYKRMRLCQQKPSRSNTAVPILSGVVPRPSDEYDAVDEVETPCIQTTVLKKNQKVLIITRN